MTPDNFSHTALITSTEIPVSSVNTFQVTNMSTNPVCLRVGESGSAVFGEGIVLPGLYATWSYQDTEHTLNYFSCIASGGSSNLAIFAS